MNQNTNQNEHLYIVLNAMFEISSSPENFILKCYNQSKFKENFFIEISTAFQKVKTQFKEQFTEVKFRNPEKEIDLSKFIAKFNFETMEYSLTHSKIERVKKAINNVNQSRMPDFIFFNNGSVDGKAFFDKKFDLINKADIDNSTKISALRELLEGWRINLTNSVPNRENANLYDNGFYMVCCNEAEKKIKELEQNSNQPTQQVPPKKPELSGIATAIIYYYLEEAFTIEERTRTVESIEFNLTRFGLPKHRPGSIRTYLIYIQKHLGKATHRLQALNWLKKHNFIVAYDHCNAD